jgi:hypothetical protein
LSRLRPKIGYGQVVLLIAEIKASPRSQKPAANVKTGAAACPGFCLVEIPRTCSRLFISLRGNDGRLGRRLLLCGRCFKRAASAAVADHGRRTFSSGRVGGVIIASEYRRCTSEKQGGEQHGRLHGWPLECPRRKAVYHKWRTLKAVCAPRSPTMLQAAGVSLEAEFVIFNSIAGERLLRNARPVRNQTFDSAQRRCTELPAPRFAAPHGQIGKQNA